MDSQVSKEVQRRALLSVEEAVKSEIRKSSAEQGTSGGSRSGAVKGTIDALVGTSSDTAYAQFLPLPGIEWPESIAITRENMQSRSTVGVFPAISRAWVVVDNKLFLWNYVTGKEIVCYDKCTEMIVSVACAPPQRGVFHEYVTHLIVIATTKTVLLVGGAFSGGKDLRKSELRLLELSFAVKTPTIFTRIVSHDATRRVFLGGLDGNLYELAYSKQATAYAPRMRLINRSIVLGGVPVLNSIGKLISSVRQTWSRAPEPVRDMIVDQNRSRLYVLTEDSTIQLWSLLDGSCSYAATAKHTVDALNSSLRNSAPSAVSPIVAIYPTHFHEGSFCLVALTETGERYHYDVDGDGLSRQPRSISACERIDGPSGAAGAVTCGYYADGVCVMGFNDGADDDAIELITTPRVMHQPHQNIRDIVTQAYAARGSSIGSIEAIAESMPPAAASTASELCAQVFSPPRLLLVLHRRGISMQIRLRPIDILHLILNVKDPARREEMVARFRTAYSHTDFCTMLIQLAVGNTLRDGLVLDSLADGAPMGVMRRLSYSSPSKSVHAADSEQLANRVLAPVSKQVIGIALQTLRGLAAPQLSESDHHGGGGGGGARRIAVGMSPYASAMVVYFARIAFPVWDDQLFSDDDSSLRISEEVLQLTDSSLCELNRLLQQLRGDVWADAVYSRNVELQWEHHRVQVVLSGSSSGEVYFSAAEATMLQTTWIRALSQLVATAMQVTVFLRHVRTVSADVIFEALKDTSLHRTRFADLCTKKDVGNKLARSICKFAVEAQKSMKAAQLDASSKLLVAMERDCPDLFTAVDSMECKIKAQLEKCARSSGALSRSRLTEIVQEVTPKALALWNSGALAPICAQLVALRSDAEAVELLLHAAAQLDVSQSALEAYFSQRGAAYLGGGGGGISGIGGAGGLFIEGSHGSSELSEKKKIIDSALAIIEVAWEARKDAFDRIMGTAGAPGIIWAIEPSDQLAHCLIFDWMTHARDDSSVAALLDALMVSSSSNFLGDYLRRKRDTLGIQLALFLRKRHGEFRAAVETYVHVARSPLRHILPPAARLEYRIRCLHDAIDCAREGGEPDMPLVAMRDRLENQQQLLGIVRSFEVSGDPELEKTMVVQGSHGRVIDFVRQHRRQLEEDVIEDEQLFTIAGLYRAFGGCVVQLEVLETMQSNDVELWVDVLELAFDVRNAPFDETARHIITRFGRSVSFPLSFVVTVLEAHFWRQYPHGCTAAVEILEASHIDLTTIISVYRDAVMQTAGVRPYAKFNAVTAGYLIHSMAFALHRLVTTTSHVAHAADTQRSVRKLLERVEEVVFSPTRDQSPGAVASLDDEIEALKRAKALVDATEKIIDSYEYGGDRFSRFGANQSSYARGGNHGAAYRGNQSY